jgi:hypothetical protein
VQINVVSLAPVALLLLGGCVSVPKVDDFRRTAAVLTAPQQAGTAVDARAQFRQLYCQVVHREATGDDPRCESSLWRLSDEAPAAAAAILPKARTDLRMLIIPGALNDCFGPDGLPYTEGIARLRSLGVRIDIVPVSGRSSSEHNARQIATFFAASDLAHSDPIVMLGYSKGSVDIEQFLADFPDYAPRVVGIIAIAGPVWGSPIANSSEWLYNSLLSSGFSGRCDPGDGGMVHSLRTDVRTEWRRAHPLPAGIGYYFVGAFTTSGHLARGLRPTWRSLAKTDTRNDGQVRIEDEVQPGGVLLGYVNADHWGAAIQIEKELDYIAHRDDGNPFPQSALLEAAWLYVGEALPAGRGAP